MSAPSGYHPLIVGANTTVPFVGIGVSHFLPTVTGTLTITRNDGTVLLNALPVTAGVWVYIKMHVGVSGGTITTAGGAAGTALIY